MAIKVPRLKDVLYEAALLLVGLAVLAVVTSDSNISLANVVLRGLFSAVSIAAALYLVKTGLTFDQSIEDIEALMKRPSFGREVETHHRAKAA